MAHVRSIVMLFVLGLAPIAPAFAQEDLEPRVVGSSGVMSLGVSGFVDKRMSSVDSFPFNLTAQVDVTRFVTNTLAVRGGLVGSASLGGDEDEPSGTAAPALHVTAGGLHYWTPQKMASLYTGGEYRLQVTERIDGDAGSVFGIAGFEAALSSRTRVFVEGGWGVDVSLDDQDQRQTHIVGEIGFRIRF